VAPLFSHASPKNNTQKQLTPLSLAPAAGIPAFFTPTASGTIIEEGGNAIKYVKRTRCC